MKIVIYGLTITSSWGNGHATTYRALLKALALRGHQIHFIERDDSWYRDNRDLPHPTFCTVHLYRDWQKESTTVLQPSLDADVVLVGSYFPDAIPCSEALFAAARQPILFYDIDTPITLARLRSGRDAAYLQADHIPRYDAYLSFTAGPVLRELEDVFHARRALPFFCSVDPGLYRPTPPDPRFQSDLSYLGTYAPDRQPKLLELLDTPAALLPTHRFLVAGPQYPQETAWQPNVTHLNHVPPSDHPAFYSSSRFTLNLTRTDMVAAGHSPSVRLFEASACGAAILSDNWPGLAGFLTPGEEILLPTTAGETAHILTQTSDEERLRIGRRARERILAEHTSAHRAQQLEAIVSTHS